MSKNNDQNLITVTGLRVYFMKNKLFKNMSLNKKECQYVCKKSEQFY